MSGVEDMLPCISLWQPYASLIFAQFEGDYVKKHETRGFRLPLSKLHQTIAIHAAARFTPAKMISPELHDLCDHLFGCSYREALPLGGIIGTVRFRACAPTVEWLRYGIDDDNLAAGDWREIDDKGRQRFAWAIDDVQPIDDGKSFLPWKGKQGWFSVPGAALSARATQETERG